MAVTKRYTDEYRQNIHVCTTHKVLESKSETLFVSKSILRLRRALLQNKRQIEKRSLYREI